MLLIVDDSVDMGQLLKRHLLRRGYHAMAVTSCAQAEMVIAQLPPEMVVLDVQMPVTDGLTYLQSLRSDPATQEMPVLIYSSHMTPERARRAWELGAAVYTQDSLISFAHLTRQICDVHNLHNPRD